MNENNQNQSKGALGLYWESYGGWPAVIRSGYLWIAFSLTLLCFNLWSKGGWWDDVLTIVPSMIGFSLAAFAMLLAFTNETFLKIVTTPIPGPDASRAQPSVYASTSAAFAHFIMVQFVALFLGFICKSFFVSTPSWLLSILNKVGMSENVFVDFTRAGWFLGFWVFLYSILSGVAATLRVFLLAHWFNKVARGEFAGATPAQQPASHSSAAEPPPAVLPSPAVKHAISTHASTVKSETVKRPLPPASLAGQ